MENIGNVNNYEDITSLDSSDESLYYSVSGSPVLPPYEEFDNYSYVSESDSSSIYSGIYEPVIGQVNPTIYPATVNYIEVLGIFPVEVRGTTFYQPLFYYLPVYNLTLTGYITASQLFEKPVTNVYYTFSPDFAQEGYDTESTEYCSTNSYTDISSSSSDTYYTAEESQSYFDEYEETNVETTSVEFYPNDDFDSSKGNLYVASESSEVKEEEGCDNVELQNEIQYTSSDDEYDYEAEEVGYFNEINVETTSLEFSPNDDFDLSKGNEYVASESSKVNEEECCDNIELQNEIKNTSADNIKNNIVETHRPFYVGDSNNRSDSSEKSSINAFEFESINYKDCQNQDLKKYKSFDDSSGKTQRQLLKKPDDFKNLSTVKDDEVHEKDFQRNDTEIRMVSHEQNEKKPKKKKMKRLREFMARIFCCVKPP